VVGKVLSSDECLDERNCRVSEQEVTNCDVMSNEIRVGE
jgi:hypothetical protein